MKLRLNYEDEFTTLISSNDALYHFTRKETAIEHILNKQKLRLGDFNLTNDPQEYKSRMTSAIGSGWDDEKHLEQISRVTRKIDNLIKSSGFISLCQNSYRDNILIEEGCLKSRMWSQYGGNHSGICLIFSRELLLKDFENSIPSDHQLLSKEVQYKDPSTRITSSALSVNGDELEQTPPETIAKNYILTSQDIVFFQKQPDYKDENEYRIVAIPEPGNSSCGKMISIKKSLKGIILGDAFPRVYLPTIKALSENLAVPYRKLHWERTEYILLKW